MDTDHRRERLVLWLWAAVTLGACLGAVAVAVLARMAG